MKKTIWSLFVSVLMAISAWSQLTVTASKDNYLILNFDAQNWSSQLVWDLTWDSENPEDAWSGLYVWDFYPSFTEYWSGGYSDELTVTVPEFGYCSYGEIAGPNYEILADRVYVSCPSSGDVWIDFNSDGTARVSTTKPTDFGKWAWDGSVNPSWVEPPLAPVQQGKRLAKGHNK